jgi:hypothetical protein
MSLLSRRDKRMVARHEMPGKRVDMIRPVGNGVILGRAGCSSRTIIERPAQPDHTVPYGTGLSTTCSQAFHAWLPSFGPSGTIRLGPYRDATVRLQNFNTPTFQYSNTPALLHSALPDSTTATRLSSPKSCPTKPKLYSADRSSRPRKRGALHDQDVGDVGSTRTITTTRRQTPNAKYRTSNAL